MGFIELLKLALFAITRNKTRAFLTMLGIIISAIAFGDSETSTPSGFAADLGGGLRGIY